MKLINHKKQLNSFSSLLILIVVSIVLSIAFSGCSKSTEQQTKEPLKMKMTTEIPEGIATPDRLDTRMGSLTFFDGGSKLAIWHGWASKHVYENTDQETREAAIDEAVAAILADLPPRVAGE